MSERKFKVGDLVTMKRYYKMYGDAIGHVISVKNNLYYRDNIVVYWSHVNENYCEVENDLKLVSRVKYD